MKDFLKKYLQITFGALLFGAGISLFIDPNNFAPGGVSGLAIILNRLLPVETGTLFFLINLPILVLGWKKFGTGFTLTTLYAILLVSVFSNYFKHFSPATTQPILAAFFGGGVTALGMGLVLRTGGTTGGTDVIVKCLRQKKPYLKSGTFFLMIDAVVIGIGGLVFGNVDTVLYSVLSAMVTSYILDLVLYGRDEAKLIYIISDAQEVITKRILTELNIGITHLSGSGGYGKDKKQVILCVVKRPVSAQVEEIVKEEDDRAFMIITRASEIYGEGYKSYFGEKI